MIPQTGWFRNNRNFSQFCRLEVQYQDASIYDPVASHVGEKRGQASSASYKGTMTIQGGSTLMTSSNPSYLSSQRLLLIPAHCGGEFQHINLGDTNIQSIMFYNSMIIKKQHV